MKLLKIIVAFFMITAGLSAAENYAVIDVQKLVFSSKAYFSYKAQMDKYQKDYADQLKKEEDGLRKIEKDLVDKREEYSAKDFAKRRTDFETQVKNYQERAQANQRNFLKVEQEITDTIMQTMTKIIKDVVNEKKYDVIYQANALVYYNDNKDISSEVLKKLDVALPKVTVKKPY